MQLIMIQILLKKIKKQNKHLKEYILYSFKRFLFNKKIYNIVYNGNKQKRNY